MDPATAKRIAEARRPGLARLLAAAENAALKAEVEGKPTAEALRGRATRYRAELEQLGQERQQELPFDGARVAQLDAELLKVQGERGRLQDRVTELLAEVALAKAEGAAEGYDRGTEEALGWALFEVGIDELGDDPREQIKARIKAMQKEAGQRGYTAGHEEALEWVLGELGAPPADGADSDTMRAEIEGHIDALRNAAPGPGPGEGEAELRGQIRVLEERLAETPGAGELLQQARQDAAEARAEADHLRDMLTPAVRASKESEEGALQEAARLRRDLAQAQAEISHLQKEVAVLRGQLASRLADQLPGVRQVQANHPKLAYRPATCGKSTEVHGVRPGEEHALCSYRPSYRSKGWKDRPEGTPLTCKGCLQETGAAS